MLPKPLGSARLRGGARSVASAAVTECRQLVVAFVRYAYRGREQLSA
jgi:hypothetical protein